MTGGNSQQESNLLEAARTGALSQELIDRALERGADINCIIIKGDRGYEGYTPLMRYVTSFKATSELVEYLLSKGANPRLSSKYGHTALSLVVYGNRDDQERFRILSDLINAGADPNTVNSSGYTPLHAFCGKGTAEEVDYLLQVGAMQSINVSGKRNASNPYWGFAPLHTAIYESRRSQIPRFPIVRLLVERGADVNLRCNSTRKYTPLELIADGLQSAAYALKRDREDEEELKRSMTWEAELEDMQQYLVSNGAM